jgi:DNA-binding IclR family transcriptional regulator
MTPDQEPKDPDRRRGIQSVEVGFRLIAELAAAHDKLPLKALAQRAGMSPSKAHLYLVSFLRLGLVVQDAATSRYGLGPAAVELGIAAINQLDVVDLAREHLPATMEAARSSVSLAVWGNRGATVVYRIDAGLPVPLSVRVGYVLPLLTTATGRVFMANLPEREWMPHAALEDQVTPGALSRATASLPAIRETFSARTVGETHAGFFGVSSPIYSSDDTIAAAVTALGLMGAGEVDLDGAVVDAVRRTAARISADLGATRSAAAGFTSDSKE